MSAVEEIRKEVAAPAKAAKGSFIILKRNMYVNSLGVAIKVVGEALVPASPEEVKICKDFAAMGLLKEVL